MPILTSFFRYFRRRLIFGLISAVLFTYCVLSLLCNEKKGLTFGNDFDDMDNMIIGENNDDIFNDEGDEDIAKSSGKPLLWQMEVLNDVGNANSIEFASADSFSDNETFSKPCRNSVQGKSLIVDERGYVCHRQKLLPNGCCSTEVFEQSVTISSPVPFLKKTRYACESCNSQGCCAIYEYCVSCCLDPNKAKKKSNSNVDQIWKENLKLRRGEDILKLRLRSLDRFQLCLAACRTSSASVQHENTYKNPHSKHCYILQLPSSHLNQRHKRNAIAPNNNENDLRIAFTSSSAVELLHLSLLIHEYPVFNESFMCIHPRLMEIGSCVCVSLCLVFVKDGVKKRSNIL